MTTSGTPGSDRLDRIEAILAALAESQAQTQAIVNSTARAVEAIAAQRAAQIANEQALTNAVLGMLDMGEGILVRIDEQGRRMDQNFAEHNRRIEDLYRSQGHILRRLFGEDPDPPGEGQP